MSYTTFANDAARTLALTLARGRYQYGLLLGGEAWSGSTLTGKAKQWSGKYAASRAALLARLREAGISVKFEMVGRRKVCIIG